MAYQAQCLECLNERTITEYGFCSRCSHIKRMQVARASVPSFEDQVLIAGMKHFLSQDKTFDLEDIARSTFALKNRMVRAKKEFNAEV